MLVLKIIGIIFLVLFLLTLISVRVVVEYKNEALKIKARYGFISYTAFPQKETKKEKKPKKEKDKDEAEKKEPKEKKDSSDKLEAFLDILRGAKSAMNILKKHFIISGLYAYIRVGSEDAHKTAVSYGNYMTAATNGLALVSEFLTVKVKRVYIEPDYLIEKSIYNGEVTFRIRPIWILVAGGSFLFNFVRLYLKNKPKNRNLKGGPKNEPKTS